MPNPSVPAMLAIALNVIIVVGWILLIAVGLEPDTPLSGGIPGHVDRSGHGQAAVKRSGRLGEVLGWALFGAVSLSLPVILLWVVRAHG